MQAFIAEKVTEIFSNTIGSKVEVESANFRLLNKIAVKNLYIEDLEKDTLLHVNTLHLRFSLLNLLRGKIVINQAEISQLAGNYTIDENGKSNIDFIVQALSNPEKTTSSSPIQLRIKKVLLQDSFLSYQDNRKKQQKGKNAFDFNHMNLERIDAEIGFNLYAKDSLDVTITSLSARERVSGFVLTKLATDVSLRKERLDITSLEIVLPESEILFDSIHFVYDSLADFKAFDKKVRARIPVKRSKITLSDLEAFVPGFHRIDEAAYFSVDLTGNISNVRASDIRLEYGNNLVLNANIELNGLPNLEETFVYGNIDNSQINPRTIEELVSDITLRKFTLPKELKQLGTIRYKGNITGFFSNLVAYGNFDTNIGSLRTDVQLQLTNNLQNVWYSGSIASENINIGKLINNKHWGNVAFNISTTGEKKGRRAAQGVVSGAINEISYNDYIYKDIQMEGAYDGNGFDGNITIEDDNIVARFTGIINYSDTLPVFNFELDVERTNLYELNLVKNSPDIFLAFKGSTNMVGNSLDNINGHIRIDSILFTNNNQTLNVDSLLFLSKIENNNTTFSIASDYINGEFEGNFLYSTIGATITRLLSQYIPSMKDSEINTNNHPNQMRMRLKFDNLNEIASLFSLPVLLEGFSEIVGEIDERSNKIFFTATIPSIDVSNQEFDNFTIQINNNNKSNLQLTTRALYSKNNAPLNLFLTAEASKDVVSTRLGWQNTGTITNAGDIRLKTTFNKNEKKLTTKTEIIPTEVIISDSVWSINSSTIDWNGDSVLYVNDFKFGSQTQYIHIDGTAGKSDSDSLFVSMNDLSIDFIMNLIGLKGLLIGGTATGEANLFSALKRPVFEAELSVKDITLNKKRIGNGVFRSIWEREHNELLAEGIITENDKKIIVAGGKYIPANDSIDFTFGLDSTNIEFLSYYFQSVVDNLQGYAKGDLRFFGKSKELGLEGDIFVQNGQANVIMLNSTFTFNDYVYFRQKSLEVKQLKLYDKERNQATANGILRHKGLFQDLKYDFTITAKNILGLNTESKDNEYFFGRAYADGVVKIFGDEVQTNIAVNATSRPKTKIYIRMASVSTASDNSFIKFVEKRGANIIIPEMPKAKTSTGANVSVNLQIEVTPEAEVELILDPSAGDMINAKGNGSLRLEFDTTSDLKLFGTYTIESGHYLFSLQNLIRKNFKIEQGSSISWAGDLMNAVVNIKATYPVTASLRDLLSDEQRKSATTRSSIPVNCILMLTDNLMSPTIAFDIDLPSSDESTKQHVRSIINTEEMMNRQILFLLLLSRFYTPDYLTTTEANASSPTGYEGLSFATATINGWLSRVIQSSRFSIGVDVRSDEQVAQYQTEIMYQPNDRLIVNGNLGYQTDDLAENNNRFIGDFDVEYLLTESGKVRFKGYSHTVDRLGVAKISQGAGFLYKEEFRSVSDMFKYYFGFLGDIWKKENDKENATNEENN